MKSQKSQVLIFCSGTFVNLLNFVGQDLDLNHDAARVPENETTASRIHNVFCFLLGNNVFQGHIYNNDVT